jgi:F-type H+-transporting ATPase subunit b
MDQLIDAFGIDVRLIIIQIVNFGLLMIILSYFLYKPILKILNDREKKITTSIKDAEAAAKAKADAESQKHTIIITANEEAEAMVSRAKDHATEKADEILSEAKHKAEQEIKNATLRAEEAKTQIIKESEAEITKLAVLAAEKILRSRV